MSPSRRTSSPPVLGLRPNAVPFTILVVVNVFVGGMLGLERAIVPLLAGETFGIASTTAVLAFVASFGLMKALANGAAGALGDRYGRKPVLVAGWILGLPVPFLLISAPAWSWIVGANVLLGASLGLTWSSTVIMKIDLVGPRQRGLAMGLNEAAGYVAVAATAWISARLAATYGLGPVPFYLGIGIAAAGLLLSVFGVRETRAHSDVEADAHAPDERSFAQVLLITSWRNRALFGVSQCGMVNNLNDGLAWGLLPIFFAARGFGLETIGLLAATYPAVWGFGQLAAGGASDRFGRRPLIVGGMLVQAVALSLIVTVRQPSSGVAVMALLGAGTAMVYPTLLAAVGDHAHPSWRATSVGVYRLWRDGGYVLGAVLAGVLGDLFGLEAAIAAVAGLTAVSAVVAGFTVVDPPTLDSADPGSPDAARR